MIEHIFGHLIARKVERRLDDWVAAGQRTEPIRALADTTCQLAFGFRYRLQLLLVCSVFATALAGFCWYWLVVEQADIWLAFAYFGLLLPAFLLSGVLAVGACTTRLTLSARGIDLRRFGMASKPISWSDVSALYRSPVTPAIVVVTRDHRRLRISTHLDGVRALPGYLARAKPGVVHRSVVDWMIALP